MFEERSAQEVMADIVRVIAYTRSCNQQSILNRANLSYTQFTAYATKMAELGFIEIHENPRRYFVTEKGLNFKNLVDECLSMMGKTQDIT